MSDPSSMSWQTIQDIINTIGVLTAILISVVGLIRSSRQKRGDQLNGIRTSLNDHILEDEHSITELQTNVKNLTDNVDNLTDNVNIKLDTIIRELDKS
jgi:ribosome recycling factor